VNIERPAGQLLHSVDDETRSEAARLMGSSRSERKAVAARINQQRAATALRGKPLEEAHREKLRQAALARWERIRAKQAATRGDELPVEKRKAGRPRKAQDIETAVSSDTAPQQGRPRAKKQP
jgi:hypothetical protein